MFRVSNREKFSDWLEAQLHRLGWSQADFSRESGLHRAIISKIILGSSKPTPETLAAIAHGLGLPAEQVFRAAGLLPPVNLENEILEQIVYVISPLPTNEQTGVLEFAKMRARIAQERGEYKVGEKTKRKPAASGSD